MTYDYSPNTIKDPSTTLREPAKNILNMKKLNGMSTSPIRLIVCSSNDEQLRRLLAAIHTHVSKCVLETFADQRSLNQRLRENALGEMWLILLAATPSELDCFSAMRELLQNMKSILILPDRRRATIIVGHGLYPRFISYMDSNFGDVGSVLEMVIKKCGAKCSQI